MNQPENGKAATEFLRLLDIMATLRSPQGCAWDRKQTIGSLKPFVLEEAGEVAEAIDRQDPLAIREELGDLSMMVVFASQIAREQGTFTITEVLKGICDKLVSRHPHVFAENDQDLTPEMVVDMWGKLKKEEKRQKNRLSARMSECLSFPSPLKGAFQIQDEAAKVGFDFPSWEPAMGKLREETCEVENAHSQGETGNLHKEVGDLIFAAVNVSRLLGIDPESALRESCAVFVRRFGFIEEKAEAAGGLAGKSFQEMDAWWEEAKRGEKSPD